jgi:pimeloyl-ACP methyl ester carboxylesterase
MFAHDYPADVAALVLVDATHEDEYLWINGKIIRPSTLTDEEWAAVVHPRKAPSKVNPPYDKLPPNAQKMQLWAMSRQPTSGGDTDDMRADFIAMHNTTTSAHPLGDLPLIVISKTPGLDDDSDYTDNQHAWNRDLQDRLAALSTNSVHVVAPHSGHHVQLDEPDVVIDAVHRVIEAARLHRRLQ